jgi:hypothetical protein
MNVEKIEWISIPPKQDKPQKNPIYKHVCNSQKEEIDSADVYNTNKVGTKPKWTIMHYGAGDNDLKAYILGDAVEMELVGSTENMNVISLLDMGKDNCKIYHIQQDDDIESLNSPMIKDLGDKNTADPQTLADFISYSMKKFPAEHYAVLIGDHGGGWQGAIIDETSSDFMTLPEIRESFEIAQKETGKKVDVIGFDACLMATGEVAYELKDVADYLVASQEVEGGHGWNYFPLLEKKNRNGDKNEEKMIQCEHEPDVKPYTNLFGIDTLDKLDRASSMRIEVTPEQLARGIVANAAESNTYLPTLSAIDLTKMDDYERAVNRFAQAILDTDTPNTVLNNIAQKTQNFDSPTLKDQAHFCENIALSNAIKDQNLKNSAQELYKLLLNEVVIQNENTDEHPNAYGLSVEIPDMRGIPDSYRDTKMARNTLWDEAMDKFTKNPLLTLNRPPGASDGQMSDFYKIIQDIA